jgi:phage shock protein B
MDEYFGVALVVLFGTLFGLVVPLWLLLHYWSKRRMAVQPSPDEQGRLQRLSQVAERLQQRVSALEAILDAQSPGWRDTQDRSHGR